MYNTISPYSGLNININTLVDNSNVVVNGSGYNSNLVVNGNTTSGYQNLLVTNGSTGQVGIKIAPNNITGNASLHINGVDSIIIPAGITSNRPSNGVAGMTRYNTSTNQLEYYNVGSSSWVTTTAAYTTISEDTFVGNGIQTSFTLSQVGTTNSVMVMINGIVQIPTTAYSVTGTTLLFTEAPLTTDIIDARTISSTATIGGLATGTSSVTVKDTGAGTGNINVISNNNVRYVANTSNYFGGGIAPLMTPISLTSGANTIVDSFSASTFTSAKYIIKMTNPSGAIQTSEMIVVANTTTANYTISSNIFIGAGFATVGANVNAGTVYIVANASTTGCNATVMPIYMPI